MAGCGLWLRVDKFFCERALIDVQKFVHRVTTFIKHAFARRQRASWECPPPKKKTFPSATDPNNSWTVTRTVTCSERPKLNKRSQRAEDNSLLLSETSRPSLWPIQPRVQWSPDLFPRGKAAGGVMFTTHLHLAPILKLSGSIPLFPPNVSMAWTRTTLPFLPLSTCASFHHILRYWSQSVGITGSVQCGLPSDAYV
jgi:hypothetical protein